MCKRSLFDSARCGAFFTNVLLVTDESVDGSRPNESLDRPDQAGSSEPSPSAPPDETYRWNPVAQRWMRTHNGFPRLAVYSGAEDWLRSEEHAFHPANVMDDPKRERIFEKAITEELLAGANVVQRDRFSAVTGRQKPVGHGLHAFLTLMTLGLWSVVWIVMAISRKEIRTRISIDRWGHVWYVDGS